jgi:hypothetical protein
MERQTAVAARADDRELDRGARLARIFHRFVEREAIENSPSIWVI